MVIYIIIFFYLVVLAYVYDYRKNSIGKIYFIYLTLLIFILFSGLRYRVGIDTSRYEIFFNECPTLFTLKSGMISCNINEQPLWFLFNIICKTISDDFVILQLIHAFIINYFICRFIRRLTSYIFLAFLFYYCFQYVNFNFEIMRESLCVAFFLTAVESYYRKHNLISFVLYGILMVFIHWFSFIILLLTIFVFIIPPRKFCFIVLLLGGVSLVFFSQNEIFLYLQFLSEVLPFSMLERVNSYFFSESYGFIEVSILGGLFIFIFQILYPLYLSLKYRSINRIIANFLLLYALIVIIRLHILIAMRLVNYLDIIFIVAICNYIPMIKLQKNLLKIYIYACILCHLYISIKGFYTPSVLESRPWIKYNCLYIPYKSYIDKEFVVEREFLLE